METRTVNLLSITVWIFATITLLPLVACQPQPTAESALSEDDVAQAVEATLTAQAENAPAATTQAPMTQAPLTQASPTPTPNAVKIVPFAAIKSRLDYWGHEVEPGWIYLYVFIAVENASSEYQHFEMESYSPRLVSAEGYSYPVERGYLTTKQLIPSGFRVWADAAPGGAGLNFHANYLIFKVAETTRSYELHVPGFSPISLSDVPTDMQLTELDRLTPPHSHDGSYINDSLKEVVEGTTSLGLAELFPTSSSAPTPLGKGDILPVGDEGEMTVVSSEVQEDLLTVTVLYRSNSGGYGQTFPLTYYVIGDDGILRTRRNFPMAYAEVGPGQEVQREAEFYVTPGTKQLKLVVLGEQGTRGVFSLD